MTASYRWRIPGRLNGVAPALTLDRNSQALERASVLEALIQGSRQGEDAIEDPKAGASLSGPPLTGLATTRDQPRQGWFRPQFPTNAHIGAGPPSRMPWSRPQGAIPLAKDVAPVAQMPWAKTAQLPGRPIGMSEARGPSLLMQAPDRLRLTDEPDAAWLDIDTESRRGNWVLTPDIPDFGSFEVPRPFLAPRSLNDDTENFHRYSFEHRLDGAERLPDDVLRRILSDNAVPNPLRSRASRHGTYNDAVVPFVPGNRVNTYERTSSTGKRVVVNATLTGNHALAHGWVASTYRRNRDGSISLLTYGEGNSPLQAHGRNSDLNERVWSDRARNVQRAVDAELGRAARRRHEVESAMRRSIQRGQLGRDHRE